MIKPTTLLTYTLLGLQYCIAHASVFRNVRDYGAKGDGISDDTIAIITALTQGRADNPADVYPNAQYNPSTKHPATVYFPPGTYKVSDTLPVIYYTQIVGDFEQLPTIKFVSTSNADIRVFDAMSNWYSDVSQNNFYRQIRNMIVDMTDCDACTGVHWQVSQATSITNVHFKAKIGSNSQGMFMENGSGGFFSDLSFEGGKYGLWLGNQQFTIRNITIRDTSIAGIFLYWDWIWTFKGVHIYNSPVGIELGAAVGSLCIVDSDFHNISNAAIRTVYSPEQDSSANSLLLENVEFDIPVGTAVVQNLQGHVALAATSPQFKVRSWGQGHVWSQGKSINRLIDLSAATPSRSDKLVSTNGQYVERSRPQYHAVDVIDVSTVGVVGDGVTDVSDLLQDVLIKYAGFKALFLPYGTYIISKTVRVPAGTRMFGNSWSVLMAKGSVFQNASNPVAMLQVGVPGEVGVAELSDLMFSTHGPQPGAKLIEWNMHDPVGQPASCGMWDVHFRIGGADGTEIRPGNCGRGDGSSAPESECAGAWSLIHLTRSSSCYLENVWGWVADHDIDQKSQINVYNARGLLCESQGPVWFYGTAMEHSVLYQYNFAGSTDIVLFMIQTETAYFQPSKNTPFLSMAVDSTDPTFCTDDYRCEMGYALHLGAGVENFTLYGAGMYSFFNVWDQACLGSQPVPTCQKELVKVVEDTVTSVVVGSSLSEKRVYLQSLNTYGTVNMVELSNAGSSAGGGESYTLAVNNPSTFCASTLVDLDLCGTSQASAVL